jgi:hypothetical protein
MPARRLPVLVLAMLVAACNGEVEVKPDGNSGDDFDRSGAEELFLDKLVDDYIDAKAGDATDWKFFKVKSKGILELTVYWDDYRDIESIVDVRDRFGALVDSRRHSEELEKDKLDLRVEPGTHFIRLFAEKGASVYTIEATFQPFDYDAPDVVPTAVPLDGSGGDLVDPVGDPDPIPRAAPRPRQGGKPAGTPRPQPRPAPAEGADEPAGRPVSGTIIRMIPGKGGGTVLTLNIGTADGVTQGARGHILDDNGSQLAGGGVKILSASDKTAQAQTNLSATQIAHRRRVKLFLQ